MYESAKMPKLMKARAYTAKGVPIPFTEPGHRCEGLQVWVLQIGGHAKAGNNPGENLWDCANLSSNVQICRVTRFRL
jgi:hypothetical protein